jgi:hypothetical protein
VRVIDLLSRNGDDETEMRDTGLVHECLPSLDPTRTSAKFCATRNDRDVIKSNPA